MARSANHKNRDADDGSVDDTVQVEPEAGDDDVMTRIQAALDEIRPALQFDGGDAEIVSWSPETGILSIDMVGACAGCSMSSVTLQAGIERIIKDRVPQVKGVVNVNGA